MADYLTYLYLLTPLHTGGSANEGNLMGIAREVHTEFPYMPASSVRGRIRAEITRAFSAGDISPTLKAEAELIFGRKIVGGLQPTEGEVWFGDATLLFFPIASLSHHLMWITCPLWLERWSRWLPEEKVAAQVRGLAHQCRTHFKNREQPKVAVSSFSPTNVYLQTALLEEKEIVMLDFAPVKAQLAALTQQSGIIAYLFGKVLVLTDEDCIALVETGLQREVRVMLEEDSKTVKGGSFRSEEAIPPEAVMFLPWGTKPFNPTVALSSDAENDRTPRASESNQQVRDKLLESLQGRLQFGGLESLGRGWVQLATTGPEMTATQEAKS
ncbi:MAG: type III-B CRISPR module RAMP protein Cmr4 [Leptolyngbya sp. SIO4C5]|nr:type III-B CRISPR module RAMP protein Cmr4 [Leptolyngbya sp. SIO4C5]